MAQSEAPLPLAGIRVVDLTCVWAGQFATQLLGDLGAEVVKVENIHVWQTMTRSFLARPNRESLEGLVPWTGGFPNMDPGDRPWNRCPCYINLFRNKLAMTCDLRTPSGREVLARLVRVSDVVYENNVTETMEKLGITYDWLCSIRPDIIFVRAPGYGSTGARKNTRAFGTQIESVIGHALLRWYADLDPTTETPIFSSDAFSGLNGAFAVMAALNARRRTGEGQLIELPQAECSLAMFPEAIMEYSLNRRLPEPLGNRDVQHAAPQGVYPCLGEDRWIALTVSSDEQWQRLCALMGRKDLAGDERFRTTPGRWSRHDELDEILADWTADHDARALMWELQSIGIAAGPVMTAEDCYHDPHIAERGYFEVIHHAETGTYPWPGMPFKMSASPLSIRRPPRALGEDNEYVYKRLLGFSDQEYTNLEAEGHVGTEFDPDIP